MSILFWKNVSKLWRIKFSPDRSLSVPLLCWLKAILYQICSDRLLASKLANHSKQPKLSSVGLQIQNCFLPIKKSKTIFMGKETCLRLQSVTSYFQKKNALPRATTPHPRFPRRYINKKVLWTRSYSNFFSFRKGLIS